MKKILKSRIFLVIITIILTLGTTVCGAILYQANQISYTPSDKSWSVTAVDEALNDLYSTMKTKLNSTTATAGNILSGKTAYSRGNLITGTMADNGAVNSTINPGESYTIPAGYHNGSGKVTATETSHKITVCVVSTAGAYIANGGWANGAWGYKFKTEGLKSITIKKTNYSGSLILSASKSDYNDDTYYESNFNTSYLNQVSTGHKIGDVITINNSFASSSWGAIWYSFGQSGHTENMVLELEYE